MKITLNIEKKYAFMILIGMLILAGVIAVYAYTKSLGSIPNPGHALNRIQGYFQGDADLELSLDKFCQSDGTNCRGDPEVQYCNTYDTGQGQDTFGWTGYVVISLIKNDRNICADENGCTYRIWTYTLSNPAGDDFYGSNPITFRQVPSGAWLDSVGNNKGINGDGTSKGLFADWHNSYLYDDTPEGENPSESNPRNQLTFRDNAGARAFVVSICDY